jgi:GxxExxY protein
MEGRGMIENELTEQIIGAAIEVHRALGPGLLESIYEEGLMWELELRGIPFDHQLPVPVWYKGKKLTKRYRIDLWVDRRVVVELKTVDQILPLHRAQVHTYLKLTQCPIGLLLNFNTEVMRYGVKRVLLKEDKPLPNQ